MIDPASIRPLVERWLPNQRWYAGKGRAAAITVTFLATMPGSAPATELWTADAAYDDGSVETYQIPLVAHPSPSESLEHVLIGSVETDEGPVWVYDALHDKDVTGAWLLGMRTEAIDGPLRFRRYVEPEALPAEEPSLVITGEQSNTSLMFGDIAILKVFRRLQPGLNPDIEVHAALGELGAKHIARLLGSVDYEVDGVLRSLAMAQEYMTTATDGWELAKTSVRDLYAEADLHADEAGGDFAAESCRLGMAVAQTHADLATAFGVVPADEEFVGRRAGAMQRRLDAALEVVPQLGEYAEGLRRLYDRFAQTGGGMPLQRIHGDLHLGQVLRTVHRWVIIDFEGEPMASLDERRATDTALRDVAGMLRSFDYAGHHRLVETGLDQQLSYRAAEWTQRNRDAFCKGYTDTAGFDPRDRADLLRAYEADKAVYEAVYEARHRPSWLPIPLASLARLAETEGAQ